MKNNQLIVLLLCLGNFTISFNTAAVAAVIPNISLDLGQSDFVVAKIVPYYMIPYGVGALLYAPLVRLLSYRLCLMLAMSSFAIASYASGVSHELNEICIAQIFAGLGAASSTPLSLMVIGEFFEKNVRGRLVGIYFGCSFFASIVGMLIMGLFHWRWLFFIPAVVAIVNVLLLGLLKKSDLDKRHHESANYFRAFLRKDIRAIFLFIFIMSFLYHGFQKWYGIYLNHNYGLNASTISIILVVAAVCGLAGQQIGGYLSDKRGRLYSCYAGLIGLAIGVFLLVGHYPLWLVTLILGIVGLSWTMSHNSISTILTDFNDADRPMIASLNSSVRFVSGGLGFGVSKYFVERSFEMTFLGIGLIFFLMLFKVNKTFAKHV